jgi:hypothetical protein
MSSRQSTAFDLAFRMGLSTFHTGATLWYRLPVLMAAGTTAADVSELNRMVSEKVVAASKGFAAAQVEWFRLATAAVTGKLDLSDVADAGTALADAAFSPSLRTVKSNSRRLSRKRRRTL